MIVNGDWGMGNGECQTGARPLNIPHSPFPIPHSHRSAFTLIEIALVLALLVVIVTIAWPALERPFAYERLRKVGDQLRTDLTKARVSAMTSGHAQMLQFDPASNRYVVRPVDGGPTMSSSVSVGPVVSTIFYFQPFPVGVSVLSQEAIDDVTPPPVSFTTPATQSSVNSTVYFHPDGTTSTAVFNLLNDYGDAVRVDLRGLTGATSVRDVASQGTGT